MFTTLIALALFTTAPRAQESEVRTQFVALAQKKDETALAKLWRDNPYEILTTIDEDLEGSLATWEKSPTSPDTAAIKEQQERALFGARVASQATGNPIFLDYASSFVGWNDAQKKSFRAGQAAFKKARDAMKSKDAATAAKAAHECADLALPLGDWWGYAMGLSAEGRALAESDKERALALTSQARVINHDLGLVGDEYGCARTMAKLCSELGRPARAHACAKSALELAGVVGDDKGKADLEKLVRECEAQLAKH